MKISNKYILGKKPGEELEASLIAQIAFGELQNKVLQIPGNPIICHSCGAAVVNVSTIKDEQPLGLHFTCEFCDSVNKIDENQFNALKAIEKNVVEYLEKADRKSIDRGDKIVACIDISGSMANKPIQGVKNSLTETLKDLAVNSPDTRFALITFTDWINLYNSQGEEVIKLEGEYLYDENSIIKTFEEVEYEFEKVGKTYKNWISFLSTLCVVGSTALGPAVLGGVSLLKGAGRIILLTDGKANRGVGNLHASSGTAGKGDFYTKIGEKCSDLGIIIEIVGIAPSHQSDMELNTIGKMAHLTGGDIYLVDLSELRNTFDLLSQSDVLGRNVKVRIFMPKTMELKDISGDVLLHREDRFLQVKIGNVNPDRKFCVALDHTQDLPVNQEIPIQIQIDYTSLDGKKIKRIYGDKITVTDKEEDIVENFRCDVSDVFYKQKAAEFGYRGQDKVGIDKLKKYSKQLDYYRTKASKETGKRLATSSELITTELDDMAQLRQVKSMDIRSMSYQSKISYGTTSALRAEARKTRQENI